MVMPLSSRIDQVPLSTRMDQESYNNYIRHKSLKFKYLRSDNIEDCLFSSMHTVKNFHSVKSNQAFHKANNALKKYLGVVSGIDLYLKYVKRFIVINCVNQQNVALRKQYFDELPPVLSAVFDCIEPIGYKKKFFIGEDSEDITEFNRLRKSFKSITRDEKYCSFNSFLHKINKNPQANIQASGNNRKRKRLPSIPRTSREEESSIPSIPSTSREEESSIPSIPRTSRKEEFSIPSIPSTSREESSIPSIPRTSREEESSIPYDVLESGNKCLLGFLDSLEPLEEDIPFEPNILPYNENRQDTPIRHGTHPQSPPSHNLNNNGIPMNFLTREELNNVQNHEPDWFKPFWETFREVGNSSVNECEDVLNKLMTFQEEKDKIYERICPRPEQ